MRFEVPQFVDVEDKIFGPFTWKQFVYLMGGAGASFALYVMLPFFLFVLFAAPLIALSAGLAFYQVNNRPLVMFLEAMTTYFGKTRLYLWDKDPQTIEGDMSGASSAPAPNINLSARNNITSLSRKLEVTAHTK